MATDPIYVDLASESDNPTVTRIDSLCMMCQGKGETRLLMTRIPHFREVILTSFECNECGHSNRGVDLGSMQNLGVKYELKVLKEKDLSRKIVKSKYCVIKIPELDFEIEPKQENGEITTLEGVIEKVKSNLSQGQEERKSTNSDLAEQIETFISRLDSSLQIAEPYTVIVDDASGNSYIESLTPPNLDPQLKMTSYPRTRKHFEALGIREPEPEISSNLNLIEEADEHEDDNILNIQEDVLQFTNNCTNCSTPCQTKMKVTKIPHFKEVIIMATDCESCGFKSNEVKSGGGISEEGKKFTLRLQNSVDLARDILKSETCSINIPELDLEVGAGIIVGKFTTVEGLLTDIKEDLSKNSFLMGDSTTDDTKITMDNLLKSLQKAIEGKMAITLVLDDPAGNSYVQSLTAPQVDPQLMEEQYARSMEQNEDMGLNDMKTENYTED